MEASALKIFTLNFSFMMLWQSGGLETGLKVLAFLGTSNANFLQPIFLSVKWEHNALS